MGVPYVTRINKFEPDNFSEAVYEPTEPSTKNSSFLKAAKPRQSNVGKVEIVKPEKHIKEHENKKIKDFLSNTNGELIGRRKEDG